MMLASSTDRNEAGSFAGMASPDITKLLDFLGHKITFRAFLQEGRFFAILEEQECQHIRSGEFARVDGALATHDYNVDMEDTRASRALSTLSHPDRKCIPLEFKTTAFRATPSRVSSKGTQIRRGLRVFLHTSTERIERQKKATEFFVFQPLSRALYVIVPKYMLGGVHRKAYIERLTPMLLCQRIPPSLLPLCVRPEDLTAAMSEIRDIEEYTGQYYSNPSTKVVDNSWDVTASKPGQDLLGFDRRHVMSLEQMQWIYNQLDGSNVVFDFCAVAPLLCDFTLTIDERVFLFEAKISLYSRTGDTIRHLINRDIGGKRCIFQKRSKFDFLFTQSSNFKEGYIVPHDQIPESWFEASVSHGTVRGQAWKPFFLKFEGNWFDSLVSLIRKTPPRTRSLSSIPALTADDARIAGVEDGEGVLEAEEAGRTFQTFTSWMEEMATDGSFVQIDIYTQLMDVCAARRSGLLFRTSNDMYYKVAEFIFVPYTWSSLEAQIYFETGRTPRMMDELQDFETCVILTTVRLSHMRAIDGPHRSAITATNIRGFNHSTPHIILFYKKPGHSLTYGVDNEFFLVPSSEFQVPEAVPKMAIFKRHNGEIPLHRFLKQVSMRFATNTQGVFNSMMAFLNPDPPTVKLGSSTLAKEDYCHLYSRVLQHVFDETKRKTLFRTSAPSGKQESNSDSESAFEISDDSEDSE